MGARHAVRTPATVGGGPAAPVGRRRCREVARPAGGRWGKLSPPTIDGDRPTPEHGGTVSHLLRLVVPDRPGILGAVATALGEAGIDIVSVDVLERGGGVAVDDIVVDLPPGRLQIGRAH